eukprot:1847847-Pyramimonas_sp.AAC.1
MGGPRAAAVKVSGVGPPGKWQASGALAIRGLLAAPSPTWVRRGPTAPQRGPKRRKLERRACARPARGSLQGPDDGCAVPARAAAGGARIAGAILHWPPLQLPVA